MVRVRRTNGPASRTKWSAVRRTMVQNKEMQAKLKAAFQELSQYKN